VHRKVVTRRLVKLDDRNARALDALLEIRSPAKANNRVAIPFRWHMVDQIHQAVFHTADAQALDDVND
jgi:hypothetical protein